MIQPDKLPIIIVANYRTSSSALASSISQNFKITKFGEPHYRPDNMLIFKEYVATGNNSFVLKVIADQLDIVEEYKSILNRDCFKIKLYRENKIDQIVSYYIATMTETWGHHVDTPKKTYFVTLDEKVAKYAIDRILLNDCILDQLPIKFDIVTTHEQLGFIENTTSIKTMQPSNIQRLKDFIERIYNESR